MSTLPLRLWLLVLVALVVATGCAGLRQARKKVDGDVVGSVRIEGATYLQQELIRAQMGQKPSSFGVRIPVLRRLVRPVPLDETLLIDDAFRVETWLAHQGWFDARVEGWRIERRRRERLRKDGTTRRAGVVVVRGVLERGPQSVVREFDIAWQDDRSPRATQRNIEGTVGRNGYVTPGLAFNLDYAEYTRDMMLAEIRNLGHAYADVDMLVDAYPDEQVVDVHFLSTSGPVTTVGEIRVAGNQDVETKDILEVLDLKPGRATRQSNFADAQQRLINLGVFTIVRVEPDLSDPTVSEVPIDVELTEGRFGTFRGGGGVVYDGTTVTPRLSVEVEHLNVDGHLARLESSFDVGAGVPLIGGVSGTKFVFGGDLGVTFPRAFGRWDMSTQLSFRRDLIASSLLYSRARWLWGFSWRYSRDITVTLGPSVEFARLGAGNIFSPRSELSEDDRLIAQATFGTTSKNPYLLTLLEGRWTADWRKEAVSGQEKSLDAKGGAYYNLGIRQAVPLSLGGLGEFQFTDLYGEARWYRSPLSADKDEVPITMALRVKWKVLPSLRGADLREAVPYPDRAFLGGALDMRGFRQNQVGPYDCVCQSAEQDIRSGVLPFWPFSTKTGVTRLEPNPTYLPRGGRFSLLTSVEARRRWKSGNTVALFADGGVLGSTLRELARLDRTLRWDVGIGYRRQTPVGPIRVDLAWRPAFGEDLGPLREGSTFDDVTIDDDAYFRGTTYGCDAFPDARLPRRVPGLFASDQLDRTLPRGVFNLSIAIGEAL